MADTDLTFWSVPITKVEKDSDGSLVVFGKATDDSVDLDKQIIDKDFARKGLADYLAGAYPTVRQMHSRNLPPAGGAVALEERPDGQYLTAKVWEPGAILQVQKGGYRAFSVGIAEPRIVTDRVAKNGRVVNGRFVEVSLVDSPANPNCKFAMVKSVGAGEEEHPEPMTKAFTLVDDRWQEEPLAKSVAASSGKCGLCEGSGKIRGGHVTCPDCGGSGKLSDVPDDKVAAQRKRGELTGEMPDDADAQKGAQPSEGREGDFPEGTKFAYTDSQGGKHLPIHDEAHVKAALGRFGQTNFEKPEDKKAAAKAILGAAKDQGISVSSDSDVAQAAKVVPLALRKLHDSCCAAYDFRDVAMTWFESDPELFKNGVAASLGPVTTQAIFGMLTNEVSEDGGSGAQAHDIMHLAAAYKAIQDFCASEAMEGANPGQLGIVLAGARDEMHKAFLEKNGDLLQGWEGGAPKPPTPGPPETTPANVPSAGKFQRPFLSGGRYRQSPPSSSGNPLPSSDHVPSPGDFERGYIDAGHAAESPANKAAVVALAKAMGITEEQGWGILGKAQDSARSAPGSTGRQFYTNAAKAAVQNALQEIHDHLCRIHPGICPMEQGDAEGVGEEPGSTTNVDTKATSTPKPISVPAGAAVPGAQKGQGDDVGALLEKSAAAAAAPSTAPEGAAPTGAPGEGETKVPPVANDADEGGLTKAAAVQLIVEQAVAAATRGYQEEVADLKTKLGAHPAPTPAGIDPESIPGLIEKAVAPFKEEIKELQGKVVELGRQPDPAGAPWRGARLPLNLSKSAEAQQGAGVSPEYVHHLEQLAQSASNQSVKQWAEKALADIGKAG